MKYNVSYYLGAIFAVPVALITGIISMNFFQLDQLLDLFVMLAAYFGAYFPIQNMTGNKYLKEMGISKSDYKYVRKELKNAQPKIKALMTQYKKVRSITDFKNVNEINKLSKTIYKTVQNDPKRFFRVDSFFFSHLDNTLNLLDQYLFLMRMPHKSKEDMLALKNAKLTLEEQKRTLQADLKALNREDFEHLNIEMNLADVTKKQTFPDKINKDELLQLNEPPEPVNFKRAEKNNSTKIKIKTKEYEGIDR